MTVLKNLAVSKVASPPSPALSGLTLVLQAGEGARFPQPSTDGPFPVVIGPDQSLLTPTNAEVALCTARSTDTLTLTRAVQGSAARAIVSGDFITASLTAGDWNAVALHKIQSIAVASPSPLLVFQGLAALPFSSLRLVMQARTDRATTFDTVFAYINDDVATSYYNQNLQASGASVLGGEGLGYGAALLADVSAGSSAGGVISSFEVLFPEYRYGSFARTWLSHGLFVLNTSSGSTRVSDYSGWYYSGNAIDKLTLFSAGGANFVAGSRATLYGMI